MLYVLLSVCCSVIVSIIIKVAKNRHINVQQLVLWNYPIAVGLTYFFLEPDLTNINTSLLPLGFYIPLALLLPTLFIFIALAVRYSGIVKADIAQRISLIIPLIAAFVIFGENIAAKTLIGIGVGLIAVLFSIGWNKKDSTGAIDTKSLLFPTVVFIGMGIIDILFKQVAQDDSVPYTTAMFIIFSLAMLVAFFILAAMIIIGRMRLDRPAIYWGLLLGAFNFGNIFLYMKAHRAIPENPSIVFTTMNIGVIVLGGLVGVFAFNEKLSKINQVGLVLAILAILLIKYL